MRHSGAPRSGEPGSHEHRPLEYGFRGSLAALGTRSDNRASEADYSSGPPSTERIWPVTQLASGEARNGPTRATSSGWPSRPNGMPRRIASYRRGLLILARSQVPPGNSIEPGATQLTRMP